MKRNVKQPVGYILNVSLYGRDWDNYKYLRLISLLMVLKSIKLDNITKIIRIHRNENRVKALT
jgi:hypothetical protein